MIMPRKFTPIPHRPPIARIDFYIRGGGGGGGGGICEVLLKKISPIVMLYESVPIQIQCCYEYSSESNGTAQEFITISKIKLEHATQKLRNQL